MTRHKNDDVETAQNNRMKDQVGSLTSASEHEHMAIGRSFAHHLDNNSTVMTLRHTRCFSTVDIRASMQIISVQL